MANKASEKVTFVMPTYLNDMDNIIYLKKALEGIYAQTDSNWQIVLIDDCSPYIGAKDLLLDLKNNHPEQIEVLFNDKNSGPGPSRNRGIQWAAEQNSPLIFFNDHDDISHIKRIEEVKACFAEHPKASVVYSTFIVIDENEAIVPKSNITPSISEILESHTNPPQGEHCWIDIGTRTGYTNLTSSTAVKTEVAAKYPFTAEECEDDYAWYLYSTTGEFIFTPNIPTYYRIPSNVIGSASRTKAEGSFYKEKTRTEAAGFCEAMNIAIEHKKVCPKIAPFLEAKFYLRLAKTLKREGELQLALDVAMKSQELLLDFKCMSIEKCNKINGCGILA